MAELDCQSGRSPMGEVVTVCADTHAADKALTSTHIAEAILPALATVDVAMARVSTRDAGCL